MSETLLIKNGVVITVDGKNRIYKDGAVAVQDGRIVDIGKTDIVAKRHKPDVVINAKKKAVLPGFVNLHCHSGFKTPERSAKTSPREANRMGVAILIVPAKSPIINASLAIDSKAIFSPSHRIRFRQL